MDDRWAIARRVAEGQHWLITSDQLRCIGLTPDQVAAKARGGSLVALMHGVYLMDADMYDDMDERTWWRAALMKHGSDAMLVGRTAARALGAEGLPPSDPAIEIAVEGGISRVPATSTPPTRCREAPLVIVRQLPVNHDEAVVIDGMKVRGPSYTIVDAGLQLDRVHCLAMLDSALHRELVDATVLAAVVEASARRRGCIVLREMAALADGRAESPLESRVRLACIDGDLAPDELQYEVQNAAGRLIAVGDLAWLKKRPRPLIAEADGKVHGLPEPVYKDRRRGNSLVIRACDTIRFTWEDSLKPANIQSVVRAALAAA